MEANRLTVEGVEKWIVEYLAGVLDRRAATIDPGATFSSLGLDSVSVVSLTGALSSWLKQEIDPTLAYDHPTVSSLAAGVLMEVAK